MDLGTLWVKIAGDAKALQTTLTSTKNEIKGFGANTLKIAEKNEAALNRVGLAATAMGAAITAGLGLGVKRFADFEQGMKNVQAVSKSTEQDFVALTEKAKEIGIETALTASEATRALYSLASAGLSASQAIDALDGVTTLALATQSDLGQSAELIVKTLAAFRKEANQAGRIADVFANAIGGSLLNMDRLSIAMPFAATTMGAFGESLETTAASLALLANNGLEASMSGTGLRRILARLANETPKAAAALKNYGLTFNDVNPATMDFVDVIGTLEKANISAADTFRIFGQRSEAARILIRAGKDELVKMTEKMQETGTAAEMVDVQMDSLSGALTMMKSSLEAAQIVIGEKLAPAIKFVAGQIKDWLNWFNRLNPSMQTIIVSATALVGLLSTFSGAALLILVQLPKMIAGFKALSKMTGLSTAAMKSSITTMGAATAAAGGLAFAYLEISRAVKEWKDGTTGANAITAHFNDQTDGLQKAVKGLNAELEKGYTEINANAKFLNDVYIPATWKTEDGYIDTARALKVYSNLLKENIEPLEDVSEATGDVEKENLDLTKSWKEVSEEFSAWTDITGDGYKATTEAQLDYVDAVIGAGELQGSALIGLANLRSDLLAKQKEEQDQAVKDEEKRTEDEKKRLKEVAAVIDKSVQQELAAIEVSTNGYKVRQQSLRALMDTEGISHKQLEALQDKRLEWYEADRTRLVALQKAEDDKTAKAAERLKKRLAAIDKETKAALEAAVKEGEAEEKKLVALQEAERKKEEARSDHRQRELQRKADNQAALDAIDEKALEKAKEILQKFHDNRELSLQEEFDLDMKHLEALRQLAILHGQDYSAILALEAERRKQFQTESFAAERQIVIDHVESIAGTFADGFDTIRSAVLEFETHFAGDFIATIEEGIATSVTVKERMEDMSGTLVTLGQKLSETSLAAGGGMGFGGVLTSLGGTLSAIAPQVGIAVGAFQTLWTIGKLINDTFASTDKIIRTALQETIKEINTNFRERFETARRLAVDEVIIEQERRRAIIAEVEKTGIEILNLTEEQHVALERELQRYNVTVHELEQQARFDFEEEEKKKKGVVKETLQSRLADLDAHFVKQSNLVRQAGGDIQKLEEELAADRLVAFGQFNVDLFDAQGNGYDRARELARQFGVDVTEIEKLQQEARRKIREEYATDFDIEEQRANEELKRLEDQFAAVNEKFAEQFKVLEQYNIDQTKLEEDRSMAILAILESSGVDLTNAYDTQYRDQVELAQEFGLQMKHVNEVMNTELLRILEEYGQDRFEIYSRDLALEFQATQDWYMEQMNILGRYNIDVTRLQQERIDKVAEQLVDAGVNVLNLTEQQNEEVLSLLARAGLDAEALGVIQNEALLKLQDEYGKRTIEETNELLGEELKLQQAHQQDIVNAVTQLTDEQLSLMAETELQRIGFMENTDLQEAEAKRTQELLEIDRAYTGNSRTEAMQRTAAINRVEEEFQAERKRVTETAYADRVSSLERVNQQTIMMEEDRARRIADILLESTQNQEMMNERLELSLVEVRAGYEAVTQSILSNDRVTRDWITTQREAIIITNELEDVLAGHSLTTAYAAVEEAAQKASWATVQYGTDSEQAKNAVNALEVAERELDMIKRQEAAATEAATQNQVIQTQVIGALQDTTDQLNSSYGVLDDTLLSLNTTTARSIELLGKATTEATRLAKTLSGFQDKVSQNLRAVNYGEAVYSGERVVVDQTGAVTGPAPIRRQVNNTPGAPQAIVPPGSNLINGGGGAGGSINVNVGNFLGGEAELQRLADDITRIQRKARTT